MKVQWKRALQTIVLGTSLLALAGCGSDNVMDIYSFGNQVIRSGQSEVTVALPYEMGKTSETTSVDGYPMDAYGSLSQHILISVEARQPAPNKALPTVAQFVDQKKSEYAKLGATVNVESIDLNGVQAQLITGDFYVNKIKTSFSHYVFMAKGVLWNITYRYPTDDQIGADISKQIKDKIYVTQKKEG